MSQYVLRRLLIAVPSLLGISLVLYTVLALAPGDPFGELSTNPNVPPEVAAALRASFGFHDPVRALGDAGRDPARLRHHRARQGARSDQGDRQARDAQRDDSGGHPD